MHKITVKHILNTASNDRFVQPPTITMIVQVAFTAFVGHAASSTGTACASCNMKHAVRTKANASLQ